MSAAYSHLTATKSPHSGVAFACMRDVNPTVLAGAATALARGCMR